jgi:amino acid adenylation domain-containing protein
MLPSRNGNILIGRFEASVLRNPSNPALEIGVAVFSYQDLNARAMQMAAVLRPDKDGLFVGLLAHRSIMAFAGTLAALYSSKAYVPLNPKFPAQRNLEMIQHSGLKTIIVGEECLDALLDLLPRLNKETKLVFSADVKIPKEIALLGFDVVQNPAMAEQKKIVPESQSENLAYLLYTSGSTGRPKAVPVSNKNVCSYLDHLCSNYQFLETDRFSQTFDLTFDLSVHDMFVCWQIGACLVVPKEDSPFAWAKYVKEKKISVWFSVPSAGLMMEKLRLLKKEGFPSLRFSFFCGEALLCSTAEKWQEAAPNSKLVNLYGPSEATIAITEYPWKREQNNLQENGIVCIGKAFPEQKCLILDENKKTCKTNQVGELYLGGTQIIDCYFKDEENTAKSFILHDKNKWYKTGDLAKQDENGNIFFLGRLDNEVKISGYRVNLFEVENTIQKIFKKEKVLVLFYQKNKTQAGKLVLFMTNIDGSFKNQIEILGHCKKSLPWYMVPESIIFVVDFEYNANRKIDRKKLIEKYL